MKENEANVPETPLLLLSFLTGTREEPGWASWHRVSEILTEYAYLAHLVREPRWSEQCNALLDHARNYLFAAHRRAQTQSDWPRSVINCTEALQMALESHMYGMLPRNQATDLLDQAIATIEEFPSSDMYDNQLAMAHSMLARVFWWSRQDAGDVTFLVQARKHEAQATEIFEGVGRFAEERMAFYEHLLTMALLYSQEGYYFTRMRRALKARKLVKEHYDAKPLRRRALVIALRGMKGERALQREEQLTETIDAIIATMNNEERQQQDL